MAHTTNAPTQDEEYGIYYRKYERYCRNFKHKGGPIREGGRGGVGGPLGLLGTQILPDLSSGDWEPTGTSVVRGLTLRVLCSMQQG